MKALALAISLVVSIPDQQLAVMDRGACVATYPVSTSKFGEGDQPGSYRTPIGIMAVAEKIGDGAPAGAAFKGRQMTGKIIRPNTPGRDSILTRILHLAGLEKRNARAYDRGIYIHGTAAEAKLGRPVSYGCIRMRSADVIELFNRTEVGTRIEIINKPLGGATKKYASK